jgi:hemolysin activation/secretion protein
MINIFRHAIVYTLLASSNLAWGQAAPDAGRLLQEQQRPLELPHSSSATLNIDQFVPANIEPGGATVTLASVNFSGNTLIEGVGLLNALGEVLGKSYDLAGLRGLADQISAYYRSVGYPFARAYLPPQSIQGGQLRIEIIEGRYGSIRAISDDSALQAGAQSALSQLRVGDVIESESLERVTLTLGDYPGIKVSPIIRPGQEVGTGDLEVHVQRDGRFSGDLGLDNHGNRFTGEYRLRANAQWDSPFTFGDQVTLRSMFSEEAMWLGSLSYSLPLSASGLRGNIGYAHTYYELAEDFADLEATGTAKVATLGLTYPVIRSQKANLSLAATWQHKKLNDKQQVAATNDDKSSESLPITLSFDRRDGLGGGGITYGSLGYTFGKLHLESGFETADVTTGQNTRGNFDKWNLDIARMQTTPVANLTLFGRLSSQWAGKNLDSSEGFSLGGANGVRAYPSGEGNGDEGWLMQLELRFAMGAYNPYLFHDAGRVEINAKPPTMADDVHRSISGTGLGLRYQRGDWNMDAALAWRTQGGDSVSDTAQRDPRGWVTVSYLF